MPLPLGHAAIGLAIHSCMRGPEPNSLSWSRVLFVAILANLPDIDVLVGLITVGNGSAFHRGPTHSLLFAFFAALLASLVWRLGHAIPRVGFMWSFLLVLSHVVADAVFTNSPVSFLWPLEVNWSSGHTGWADVTASVTVGAYNDAGVIFCFALLTVISELFRHRLRTALARNAP